MFGLRGKQSPQVRSLLERERAIPPLPAAVRGRALARARAALATGVGAEQSPLSTAPRRMRWVAAAILVLRTCGAAAAAAYRIGIRARPVAPVVELAPTPRSSAPAAKPAVTLAPNSEVTDLPAPMAAAPATPSRADAAREELRLLRQARAAVARTDFAAALPPLTEHARRFKDGRLAEEREALRVKALAGLGRTDEARRAAAAFKARFPRSVLLPIVSQMPSAAP
jgi:hypothetical protein